MNNFQIVILVVFPCFALLSVLAMLRGWISRRECLVATLASLGVCTATAWPELTSVLAKHFGIGRGADLLIYTVTVTTLVGFWMVYLRLRAVQRQLTLLVRHLAIREAQEFSGGGDNPTASGGAITSD